MGPPYMDAGVCDSAFLKEARDILKTLDKSAEDVVVDYLPLL